MSDFSQDLQSAAKFLIEKIKKKECSNPKPKKCEIRQNLRGFFNIYNSNSHLVSIPTKDEEFAQRSGLFLIGMGICENTLSLKVVHETNSDGDVTAGLNPQLDDTDKEIIKEFKAITNAKQSPSSSNVTTNP